MLTGAETLIEPPQEYSILIEDHRDDIKDEVQLRHRFGRYKQTIPSSSQRYSKNETYGFFFIT